MLFKILKLFDNIKIYGFTGTNIFFPSSIIADFSRTLLYVVFIMKFCITIYATNELFSTDFTLNLQLKPWRHGVNGAKIGRNNAFKRRIIKRGYIWALTEYSFGLLGYLYLANTRGSCRVTPLFSYPLCYDLHLKSL